MTTTTIVIARLPFPFCYCFMLLLYYSTKPCLVQINTNVVISLTCEGTFAASHQRTTGTHTRVRRMCILDMPVFMLCLLYVFRRICSVNLMMAQPKTIPIPSTRYTCYFSTQSTFFQGSSLLGKCAILHVSRDSLLSPKPATPLQANAVV